MKFDPRIKVYGDTSFRGNCPTEAVEQVTFFAELRDLYPTTWGRVATHIRNEGKRTVQQAVRDKLEGLTKGAADIIIPADVTFVCEMKRQDHTKSQWQEGQVEYLLACQRAGAFVCVALGWEAAMVAFQDWLDGEEG